MEAQLIKAAMHWNMLTADKHGNVPPCPLEIIEEAIERCLHLDAEQSRLNDHLQILRDRIGIITDGWTAHERYEDALEENKHVKAELVEGENVATRKEILDDWPFDDHNED
ncbi:hypothetical protein LTS18_007720 [Coniosporium uncinatum]|uniref:Uncharacterized protein n=1 Tax=Coniosporium uncinatum TaxID=93489 RepID=A0ACC3DAP9_9PEZI|nr:hypothetical protein LTS18_007720 [Coniosporium uncinatum]